MTSDGIRISFVNVAHMENSGPGSRGVENMGSDGGKHGLWRKTRVWWKTWVEVENKGSGGKHGLWWKTRGQLENMGSGVKNM